MLYYYTVWSVFNFVFFVFFHGKLLAQSTWHLMCCIVGSLTDEVKETGQCVPLYLLLYQRINNGLNCREKNGYKKDDWSLLFLFFFIFLIGDAERERKRRQIVFNIFFFPFSFPFSTWFDRKEKILILLSLILFFFSLVQIWTLNF